MQKNAQSVIDLFLKVIPQIEAFDDVCVG
jgi:hypothetical protein